MDTRQEQHSPIDGEAVGLGDVGSNLCLLLVGLADGGSLVDRLLSDDCGIGLRHLHHDRRTLHRQLQVSIGLCQRQVLLNILQSPELFNIKSRAFFMHIRDRGVQDISGILGAHLYPSGLRHRCKYRHLDPGVHLKVGCWSLGEQQSTNGPMTFSQGTAGSNSGEWLFQHTLAMA